MSESAGQNSGNVLKEFDAAWDRGDRPEVVPFLDGWQGERRTELAAELIRLDLDRRLKLGEHVCVDEYLRQIPELRAAELELVALLIDEHSMRTEAGQIVTLDEYARRFPEHVDTLRNELGLTDDRTRSPSAAAAENATPQPNELPESPINRIEQLEPGKVIGDFRIERLLGAGGVSQVFLATQLSLDRQVALKVTVESDEDSSAANEGRTMAAFSHPHIVPVFAEERIGRLRLLAMEYVDGPPLSDFLNAARNRFHGSGRDRMPTAAEALSLIEELCSEQQTEQIVPRKDCVSCRDFLCGIFRDLARALSAAAAKGILHSDVKPANILLTRDGKAMLADFNVSLRQESNDGEPPQVGGTLLYMSPEQLGILTGSETAVRLDERSDVYSLGLVLFETLTGGWPFLEGNVAADPIAASGQLQASRLSSPIEFPSGNKWLTPGLRSIIEKCLAPQPDDRYQSADELAVDLDRFLSHRPLSTATDPSHLERTSKWIRRSPARAMLVATVLGVLSVLIVMSRQEEPPTNSPNTNGAATSSHSNTASIPEAAKQARQADDDGQRLLVEGRFQEAAEQFEIATNLNPQMATTWHNLGVARFRLGQFADSLSAFDRSIALGNESGLAYSHRAAARFALGDEPGAESDFETAMQVATQHERQEVRANFRDFETLRASRQPRQAE
ncbi:MAG: serine/threonine-protein kinase [Planctomycetota bacterium]|nr:serine/threonine-protein kinase [Planctomycetota bacterium]